MKTDKKSKLIKNSRFGMRAKLNLSFLSISVILLISSLISILEYRSMSNYLSKLIDNDVNNISIAKSLGDYSSSFNYDVLAYIGDDISFSAPELDSNGFLDNCESLSPYSDTVKQAFSAYALTYLELKSVVLSETIDTRDWYYNRFQPKYETLKSSLDHMMSTLYEELRAHTRDFDGGFYRSIIPGSIAVVVALLLVLLLQFFIISYYIKPLLNMEKGIRSFRTYSKSYAICFDGDDELSELNSSIKDICEENVQLKKQLAMIKKQKADVS